MKHRMMMATIVGLLGTGVAHAADITSVNHNTPIVMELFTSQGCSSCPPADALLKRLSAENGQLLPLSFHVNYWNNLGWEDPYSSQASTDRQRGYAGALDGQVYTPELVVNGEVGVVGSDESRVRSVLNNAQSGKNPAQAQITADPDGHSFHIAGAAFNAQADVWEIHFHPFVRNAVDRGENGGRMLEHINSVTAIKHLGTWSGSAVTYHTDHPPAPTDRTAILVQLPNYGRIVGAYLFTAVQI